MNHLPTILLALLLFTGCKLTKEERRMNRATKKLEKLVTKFPELKRTDTLYTIVPPKIIHGAERLTVDTSKVDSLRRLLATCSDAVINRVIDYIPSVCYIAPVLIDDSAFTGRIWIEGGKVNYNIQTKPFPVATPCPTIQPTKYEPSSKTSGIPWWIWVAIGLLTVMLFLALLRR